MNSEVTSLVINAALYVIFAIYCIKKYGLSYKTLPVIMWVVSSIVAILYFTHPFRPSVIIFTDKITITPLLFVYSMFIISYIPLLKFDNNTIKVININQRLFFFISGLIIILAIIPLYENVAYFYKNMFSANAYMDNYNDKHNGENLGIFNSFSAMSMRYLQYFRGVIPIMLFLSFSIYIKKNKYISIGLIIAYVNVLIFFLNSSSRFGLVTDLLYTGFISLIFFKMKSFEKRFENKLKIFFGILVILFVIGITTITLQRFGESSKGIDFALDLYAGEGFCNFAGDMWNMDKTTNGENCFSNFIYKIEGKDNINRNYLHLQSITHRRMNVFYTFVGDYFTDFGPVFTVIFVIILTLLCIHLTKTKKYISLGPIIFISMQAKVLVIGITYWTYLNYSFELIVSILVALSFSIFNNKKTYYQPATITQL